MIAQIKFSAFFVILLAATLLALSSCEKDITVDLPDPEIQLVIEGYINTGGPAYVFISNTAAFFAPVDSLSLLSATEKNALVIVSDGVISDTLVPPVPGIGYFYISPTLIGEVGKTYTLSVRTQSGKIATAITSISPPVTLDSIWFQRQSANDTLGWIWARLSDSPLPGNNYRWFAKRLGKDVDFIAPIGSVIEDKFFNGLSFDFAYNRGKKPNSIADDDNNEEEGFFKVGDTIVVKFASITGESFDFWRAAETQASSNGNPFGSPAPLKSTINGGIGIWEGFSFTLDTTVAQ
ncbi:MAG: DUF4249 domain-containing protein [Bacteroidota bacterium]|nr:DUF4249 domain-containing protein [Bacteroidota bacterium]